MYVVTAQCWYNDSRQSTRSICVTLAYSLAQCIDRRLNNYCIQDTYSFHQFTLVQRAANLHKFRRYMCFSSSHSGAKYIFVLLCVLMFVSSNSISSVFFFTKIENNACICCCVYLYCLYSCNLSLYSGRFEIGRFSDYFRGFRTHHLTRSNCEVGVYHTSNAHTQWGLK